MGAVASLNSLMAVLAPVIGAPLLGLVSHRRRATGASARRCTSAPLLQAWPCCWPLHFRREAPAAGSLRPLPPRLNRLNPCTTRS
jgi:DHA1 family tetracycline resistance protein-like MFS transporter